MAHVLKAVLILGAFVNNNVMREYPRTAYITPFPKCVYLIVNRINLFELAQLFDILFCKILIIQVCRVDYFVVRVKPVNEVCFQPVIFIYRIE